MCVFVRHRGERMKRKKKKDIHEVFVPGFTPPSVSKDWERSLPAPNVPYTHLLAGESAKLLKAQHFFIHDEENNQSK